MSDNVYKVLLGDDAPFGGLANKNCNDRIIKGFITQVHYDLFSASDNSKPVLQQNYYRTVDVQWLEGKLYESKYVRIPETVSFKGYGLNYLPSVGDVVYAAFDTNNDPIIISIVARCSIFEHGALNDKTKLPELNNYGDPLIDIAINGVCLSQFPTNYGVMTDKKEDFYPKDKFFVDIIEIYNVKK